MNELTRYNIEFRTPESKAAIVNELKALRSNTGSGIYLNTPAMVALIHALEYAIPTCIPEAVCYRCGIRWRHLVELGHGPCPGVGGGEHRFISKDSIQAERTL